MLETRVTAMSGNKGDRMRARMTKDLGSKMAWETFSVWPKIKDGLRRVFGLTEDQKSKMVSEESSV